MTTALSILQRANYSHTMPTDEEALNIQPKKAPNLNAEKSATLHTLIEEATEKSQKATSSAFISLASLTINEDAWAKIKTRMPLKPKFEKREVNEITYLVSKHFQALFIQLARNQEKCSQIDEETHNERQLQPNEFSLLSYKINSLTNIFLKYLNSFEEREYENQNYIITLYLNHSICGNNIYAMDHLRWMLFKYRPKICQSTNDLLFMYKKINIAKVATEWTWDTRL